MELIFLGTGNAGVTLCYNTCFAIGNGDEYLLVDGGGGNGILRQLELADIPLTGIHNMFVTHAHTDHIFGAVWVIRYIAQAINAGKYEGIFNLYSHKKVIDTLRFIVANTLPKKIVRHLDDDIKFVTLTDGDSFTALDMTVNCFDIHSSKEIQYGFSATMPSGKRIVCLGDEPYCGQNRNYAENADWLLCEAFCLYAHRERFKPYEKYHSTALDAGRIAAQLSVKNLVLYHTEDKTLSTRRASYTEEAAKHFDGNIFVPDDLDRIPL